SGRVAPVYDFSSARVKLPLLACPKRTVLSPVVSAVLSPVVPAVLSLVASRCEPATGGILTKRYGTLKSAAVRARMRDPGRLPGSRYWRRGCGGSGPGGDVGAEQDAADDPRCWTWPGNAGAWPLMPSAGATGRLAGQRGSFSPAISSSA